MVPTKGDDSGKCLSILGWALLLRIRGRSTGEDGVVSLLDLVKSPCVIISGSQYSLESNLGKIKG